MHVRAHLARRGRRPALLPAGGLRRRLRAGGPIAEVALLKVKVTDAYGSGVPGALATGPAGSATTGADGSATLVIGAPGGNVEVTVTRETFEATKVAATVTMGRVDNEVSVTLERLTAPAGGSLASRSGVGPVIDASGQRMSFEVELIVIDGHGQPVQGLSAAEFQLLACSPDPANDHADCVHGAAADVAYAPVGATPEAVEPVPGNPSQAYAAALMLDQSGSIVQSDPSGARLFSAKAFLDGLGSDDRALLAAFASDPGGLIPSRPLTVWGPFRDRTSAGSYFPTLDALGPMASGGTPLYDAIDRLAPQVADDPALPPGVAKAIVVFTDGADTTCGTADGCRARREASIQGVQAHQMRLFTIGLSNRVDLSALAELAYRTGGAMLYADSAEQLLPLYGSVGRLLSLSLPTYRVRWTVAAATDAFKSGAWMHGRVRVTADGSSFDVPMVVGIP